MPVQFAPTPPGPGKTVPPQDNGPPPSAPSNRSKITTTTTTTSTPPGASAGGMKEILKTVTPNYVVAAVIKNRLEERKIKAQKKKRRTRSEILAGMDLRELQVERLAMARMGFLDKTREVERWIEAERKKNQKDREEKEQSILAQKLGGLEVSHRRRLIGLENKQQQVEAQFRTKCEKEKEDLRLKHKQEYDMLIELAAQRACGGIYSCQCQKTYLCRHNKTASYNTRKPTLEVIQLRQNAERLRATGRIEEAEEFEIKAQDLDDACDKQWRTRVEQSIVSSAWSGGKSRLEQLVERQQHTMKSLEDTHEAKFGLLVKQLDIQRRNLKSNFEAKRKKVVMHCRRAALKRMTRDIKDDADEERKTVANKSDGMDNVFLGKGCTGSSGDDNSFNSAAGRKKEELKKAASSWVAPRTTGVSTYEAIVGYEEPKTGKIYQDNMEEMKTRGVTVGKAVEDYDAVKKLGENVDTSGFRFNNAFHIARAENQRSNDKEEGVRVGVKAGGSLPAIVAPASPRASPTMMMPGSSGVSTGGGVSGGVFGGAPASSPGNKPAPAITTATQEEEEEEEGDVRGLKGMRLQVII